MKEIVRISTLNLSRLNNAEYTNLAVRMNALVVAATAEALGIETDDQTRYAELIALMQDLVARSYAAAETAALTELDKQRDALGQYIIDTVRSGRSLPLASKAEAAEALWPVLKPYVGFYALPVQQETVTVDGMLLDLGKSENTAHVTTLGLNDYVTELASVNEQYRTLTEQRTAARAADTAENSKTLRAEMDALYDYITTRAFCESVVKPTEATATFVSRLNAVIDETETAYNQRMAQQKAAVKKTTAE